MLLYLSQEDIFQYPDLLFQNLPVLAENLPQVLDSLRPNRPSPQTLGAAILENQDGEVVL